MDSITIRGLPDGLKQNLRIHAAHAGMPLETYLRSLLTHMIDHPYAETQPERITTIASRYFGAKQGADIALPVRSSHRGESDFTQ